LGKGKGRRVSKKINRMIFFSNLCKK
jgi:hypothetical protein